MLTGGVRGLREGRSNGDGGGELGAVSLDADESGTHIRLEDGV